jgi:hypothetical protein
MKPNFADLGGAEMLETIRTTETGTNTRNWTQLLKPVTRQDLLRVSVKSVKSNRASQLGRTESLEERTHRLLEDIERGVQKRLDEWCPQRTQNIRTTRKNVLRALRRRVEKQARPKQYTYPELKRLIQARIQKTLDNTPHITYPRPRIYAPRRKKPRCLPEPSPTIPEIRRKAYQTYSNYKGSIHDLFKFYPFDKWDKHPAVRDAYQNPDLSKYAFSALTRAHIVMCKSRIPTFTQLWNELRDEEEIRELCGLGSVPSRKLLSRGIDLFGTQIYQEIYKDLGQTCLRLGLAKGRIVGIDGSLVESGISPYRTREDYQRVGADIFTRGGRRPHVKGVGHLLVDVVDLEYGQPLYSHTTMGSRHEGPLGLGIIDGFYQWYGYYPEILVVDKAYDSEELNQGLVDRGVQPYIQARGYGQNGLIRLNQYWNLKTKHLTSIQIHPGFLKRILSLRTESERNFSRKNTGYGRRKMTNQGEREAIFYTTITSITSLLTAVCAYHCARPDLVCSPVAFSRPITSRN